MSSGYDARDTIEMFDPILKTFSLLTEKLLIRTHNPGLSQVGDKIWCIGGKEDGKKTPIDPAPVFQMDPKSGKWETLDLGVNEVLVRARVLLYNN